jgi:hypothetical protein
LAVKRDNKEKLAEQRRLRRAAKKAEQPQAGE